MFRPLPALLDELAANATAPPTVQFVDGWVLRAAPAWPFRRSNSATPLYPLPDHEPPFAAVEDFFARHGLPARVQVSSAAPPTLDEQLAARGYEIEAPVDILTAGGDAIRRRIEPTVPVAIATGLDARWIDAFAPGDARLHAYRELLCGLGPAAYAATADLEGQPAAVGIGVVERGWVGIFGMQTQERFRRQGAARSILHTLAGLAPRCYLQVEVDNDGGQSLYARAGFTRSHGYHYRTRF